MLDQNINKISYFIFSLIPFSIIAGPTISLICILFLIILYTFTFFTHKHYKFLFNNNTIKILIILYCYLILNSLISLNYEIGIFRNLGFIRFIFLFIAINYLFYIHEKKKKFI